MLHIPLWTLSASTVISLMLLLPLLLFSFGFICKHVKVCAIICVYLQVFLRFVLLSCFFTSGFVVCVGKYLCEMHKLDQ